MSKNNDAQAIRIDSRKFLGAINDSAQSRVEFFESRIKEMGKAAGKNYRLVALQTKGLYFEDVDGNHYYVAEYSRDKGGRTSITNIRPVEIVEEEKQGLFAESCLRLVSAIEENDQKSMQTAFKRMTGQRFSGRVVPYSGMVKGRDNVVRRVPISGGATLGESVRARLISTIVESLRDKVIVENGRVVSGHFSDGAEVRLPVTKWAARKLVARRMRDTAQNAYWSEGFQKRVYGLARLVSEGKVSEAVNAITPFLEENEEFTLLSNAQARALVENALAANAIFNDQLVKDTATLFHRTNMRISKNKIVHEWRKIAKKAEHPVLAENVQILETAKNFEAAYDKFLGLIFEAFSNKQVAASALATALGSLKTKTPKIRESHDLSSKLDNLIARLQTKDIDEAAIYEAEDLIATIQEELAATDTLSDFDAMPGDDLGMDAMDTSTDSGGQPVININSPLIQIGGKSSAAGDDGLDDLGDLGDLDDMDSIDELEDPEEPQAEDDDELAAILGGGQAPAAPAAPPAAGAAPQQGFPESRRRRGKSIKESRPNHYEMAEDDEDDAAGGDCDELEESTDQYALRSNERIFAENSPVVVDYGAPVITDTTNLHQIVKIMRRLATEHKLTGRALNENVGGMAEAAIKAVKLRIPNGRMGKAIEECVTLFNEFMQNDGPGSDEYAKNSKIMNDFLAMDGDDEIDELTGQPMGMSLDDDDPMMGGDHDLASALNSDFDQSGMNDDPMMSGDHDLASALNSDFDQSLDMQFSDQEDDDWDDGFDDGWTGDGYDMDGMDDDFAEDQFKGPRRRGRGYRRTAYAPREVKNESIQWGKKQPDAMLGKIGGVKFIFDHGGDSDLAPVILSEDGSVEIPIPSNLYDSAFAAAGMAKGNASAFQNWLCESIEQLRPIGEPEDRALAEAMATIKTTPDGGISVEVSDDVDVDDMPGAGGIDGDMDDDMDDDMDIMGMEPVDSVEPADNDDMGGGLDDIDNMPDFEDGDEMGDGEIVGPAEDDEEGPPDFGSDMGDDEDDEDFVEDRDVTHPRSAKYTTHVKDNPRDMPKHKIAKAADDDLDEIGPDVKEDDGSGTKPPTAKSMSKE